MGTTQRYLNILLALQTDTAFDRRAFAGIAACAHAHGDMMLHIKPRNQSFDEAINAHDIDGIVLSSDYEDVVEEVIATGKPCVNVANFPAGHDRVPMVGTDDGAIGTLIAEHYLQRGFRHFASFADIGVPYFRLRFEAFAAAVSKAGFECHIGPTDARWGAGESGAPWETRAGKWLGSLPRPLAVMAPYDAYAREAVIACKTVGLRVPEDVSIIGVDNDEMLCMTIWPQLSSVATRGDQIGYDAIGLLCRLIRNREAPPAKPILVKPGEIVIRGSSSETAVEDAIVADAIAFVRSNAGVPVRVSDVVDHVAVSRRTLERRFVAALGRNIADEIRRAHVDRARKLLIETDLPLPEVARRSGLIQQQQLSRVIKEDTGQSPRQLRAAYRLS